MDRLRSMHTTTMPPSRARAAADLEASTLVMGPVPLSRIRGFLPGGPFGQASSRELGFGTRFITENCCLMLCLLHLFAKLENGGDGDEEAGQRRREIERNK